ncbi:MAG: response regulator, partial [Anaerolineae bacterium]|nr:response regulator [Anaerolineae bacterium]
LEDMIRLRAQTKKLQLTVKRTDLPQFIRNDEVKLRQVLINLLNNALKFTEDGEVTLRMGGQPDQVNDSQSSSPASQSIIKLFFEVEDTGPGIAAEELATVFDAFVQTRTGQSAHEGTGLGLTISYQFVQLMGGDIRVESQMGQGSIFSFEIPFELADRSEIEPEHPSRRVIGLAPATAGPYRILVVEDSADNRVLLSQLLAAVGFEVQEAVNGQQGLDLYRSWQPHLIWMDIRMPIMDGYQASRAIKSGNGPETVIIALTASAFDEERSQVLAAGCDDFVRKPFREAEIFEKMADHLNVAYVYEELEPVTQQVQSGVVVNLTGDDLAPLPSEWIAQLRQAASRGRREMLYDLIGQIKPEYPQLADGLASLVKELRFEKIVVLTE